MGGPSYQQPSPVKRSNGTEIIWDWNKRDFVPYDRAAADRAAAEIQAHPGGTPDAYGERGDSPAGTAPSPPTAANVPATGNKRLTIQERRRPGGPQPYGAGSSLLTSRNDR